MVILETKHTLSRLNKIKKDLLKTKNIISYVSIFIFLAYYAYLVSLNLNNLLYLIIYSVLIVSICVLFLIDVCIKENKQLFRKEQRKKIENKRKLKNTTKILKFIAKSVLVIIAIYETIINFNLLLPNIINIVSAIILLTQILFEIIIQYTVKEIDCFKLSIELDIDGCCGPLKKLIGTFREGDKLEDKIYEKLGESKYTTQESIMIEKIKAEAQKYDESKQDKITQLKKFLEELEARESKKTIFKVK